MDAGNKATKLELIQIFRANGIISLRQGYGPTSRVAAGLLVEDRLWGPGSGVWPAVTETPNPKP